MRNFCVHSGVVLRNCWVVDGVGVGAAAGTARNWSRCAGECRDAAGRVGDESDAHAEQRADGAARLPVTQNFAVAWKDYKEAEAGASGGAIFCASFRGRLEFSSRGRIDDASKATADDSRGPRQQGCSGIGRG